MTVLNGNIPDCVPVSPDFSNMIPARMMGKPFCWEQYLYDDPPIREAYIECAQYFNINSLMDGYFPLTFSEERNPEEPDWECFIVFRNNERIVTQASYSENGKRIWHPLKRLYGDKVVLKGNLHTTEVMLRGNVETLLPQAKKRLTMLLQVANLSFQLEINAGAIRPTKTCGQWLKQLETMAGTKQL